MDQASDRLFRTTDHLLAMERKLRHLKGFDGWVIGTCSFTVSPDTGSSIVPGTEESFPDNGTHTEPAHLEAVLLRQSKRMAQIQVRAVSSPADGLRTGCTDQMQILLLRPADPLSAEHRADADAISGASPSPSISGACPSPPPAAAPGDTIPLCFTGEEVDRYLALVSDYNSIHRGEDAIVPGFLLINRILELFWKDQKPPVSVQADVRFSAPLKVRETAILLKLPDCAENPGTERNCLFLLRNQERQILLKMKVSPA